MVYKAEDDQLNRLIGSRLRNLRRVAHISQERLAGLLHVSQQQLYKYESGADRLRVDTLTRACRLLDVQVAYFFEMPDGETLQDHVSSEPLTAETSMLMHDFMGIPDPAVRRSILDFVRNLASNFANGPSAPEA